MGNKSRSNWNIGVCSRFDCKNRDKKCNECLKFNKYRSKRANTPRISEEE